MQVAEPVSMAPTKLFMVMQFFADLENANFSKAGCRWLSKANWKLLHQIYLSNIRTM